MKAQTLTVRVRGLLLALIGLALLLAVLLWHGVASEELRLLHPALQELPADAAITRGQRADVEAAVQQPLFWQSRVPVPSAAAGVAADQSAPAASIEGFQLLGVIIDRDKFSVLLRTPQGVKRVGRGQEVQGWMVEQVSATGATLSAGGRQVELSVVSPRHPGIRLDAADAP